MATSRPRARASVLCLAALLSITGVVTACRKRETAPPVATPSVTLSHVRAPAGSMLEITYRFDVAKDAQFTQDYTVMAHVVDVDEALMWTDDHRPPVPTTQWKPGQPIQYTRTVFVPVYPYVGEATIQVGLYSLTDQTRLPLAGEDVGHRAYKVARLQLQPQTENLFMVYKDGWHPAESATNNASVEWQWTKKEATLAFKNPKKDAVFYLDVDSPSGELRPAQQVRVLLGSKLLDEFTPALNQRTLRRIALPMALLGSVEMSELQIAVDKTFVPAQVNPSTSKDPRELGVRVFHAYVDAR